MDTTACDTRSDGDVEFLLMLLLGLYGRRLPTPVNVQPPTMPMCVRDAIAYIAEHYAAHVTLATTAAAVGLSPSHLSKQIAAVLRVPFRRYLASVRVVQARRLLGEGVKADAVALLVGYQSKTHFYRHFKETCGVTPRQYQLQARRSAEMEVL